MDIVEFVEKICGVKLLESQKEMLRKVEKAHSEGKKIYFIPYHHRNVYSGFMIFMGEKELKEENNGTVISS